MSLVAGYCWWMAKWRAVLRMKFFFKTVFIIPRLLLICIKVVILKAGLVMVVIGLHVMAVLIHVWLFSPPILFFRFF